MYALYLTASPDNLSEGYDLRKSYPIILIVNTFSKNYAMERAEKVLLENHWKNIDFQKIGVMSKNNKDKDRYSFADEFTEDYRIFVFPNAAKDSRIQNLVNKAQHFLDKLIHPQAK